MKQLPLPTFKLLLLSASCSLILSGCGESTSLDASSGNDSSTSFDTPVSVVGRITAFGSIFVNGVKYEVDNASLKNDRPDGVRTLNESDLKIGMVVNINGSRNGTKGSAASISYNELIAAPVTNVTIDSDGIGSLMAGGKQINISETTMFHGDSSRESLLAVVRGDWIQVSGYVGSDGSIDATMISFETEAKHANRAELEGIVSKLDTTSQQLTLNGIDVDYSTAIITPTSRSLADGISVEVSGKIDIASNTMLAKHIKLEHSSSDLDKEDPDSNDEDENHELELQGIVSGAATGQFTLAGVEVIYDATTRLSGLTIEQIQDGLFLEEVEGRYNAAGQLVASKIKVENHSINGVSDARHSAKQLKLSGSISAIDSDNSTLTVMGYDVAITASTLLQDNGQGRYRFNIKSLSVGDYVDVVLIKNADDDYTLRKLQRERMESASSLKGVVSQVNDDGIVIVGKTKVVLPDGNTATVGQKIEVEGSFDLSSQTFNVVSIESDK